MNIPRQYSLIKIDPEYSESIVPPFRTGEIFIFLGEIPNMSGHCVILNTKTHEIHYGYHTEDFVELTEDEV